MINFPNAKINLGLRITSKRDDGYHNLDTVFYPVPLCDILELVTDSEGTDQGCSFTSSGKPIPESPGGNICIKAYQLLKADFPDLPAVKIHLHKVIPMGAGLGGGSSDGAYMLRLINDKFKLNLSSDLLEAYALRLGSDCPFFIRNKPAHGTGRGELLQEISLSLEKKVLLLVSPGMHISTAIAFAGIHPSNPENNCAEVIQRPITDWKDFLFNDFEKNVFSQFPALDTIKKNLYGAGALYASMTGTGSTVYGIFDFIPNCNGMFPASYETTIISEGKVKS